MKATEADPFSPHLRHWARWASWLAVTFGCLGLLRWMLLSTVGSSVRIFLPTIVPNTAAGFILLGLALGRLMEPGTRSGTRRLAQAGALAVVVMGVLTAGEYLLGWEVGIDAWLFPETVTKSPNAWAGRPAFLTAVNFVLLGCSLVLLDHRSRSGRKPAELFTLTTLIISLLGLIGYVCNVPLFYGWRSVFPNAGMSFSSMGLFLILGTGVLAVRPVGGLMELIMSRSSAGILARRLILAPVFIPLTIGWVRLMAQQHGFYNAEFVNWLQSFANIFVFTLAIWWCARLVHRSDEVRLRAEREVQELNGQLEHRIAERTAELAKTLQALRDGEERLQLILDTALDAVITADDRGRITSWNPEAEHIFGWKREEILGRNMSETIIPVKYREAHERGLRHFLASGEGTVLNRRIEISALRQDGQEFPVELAITPLRQGTTVAFSAFVRDITERKQTLEAVRQLNSELEQRVRERTAQLEATNSELEAFSYSVSHDLRAPLRHVAGFVELLRAELQPEVAESSRRYLEVITDSAQQMGTLIDNLLSFSRMGRADLNPIEVDSDLMVREVLRELEVETRGRTIQWDIAPLPVVNVDPALLKQVWTNLLSNAVKYTRHRERAEISVRCHAQSPEFEFVVQDNGAGFDMKYAGKLFGVFQRLHLAEEFDGTGIGLANVRRIVARHGGRTWAEGEVDVGATFHFTVPMSKQP